MFPLFLRRLRPAACLLLLPFLGSCDNQEINAQNQTGAWHIRRVSTQTGLAPSSTTDVATDVGDLTFTALANNSLGSAKVQCYFDKPFTSRFFQALPEPGGGNRLYYTADMHERRRVIINYVSDRSADIVVVYTLTADEPDHQRWLRLGLDREGRVDYREEWELERL